VCGKPQTVRVARWTVDCTSTAHQSPQPGLGLGLGLARTGRRLSPRAWGPPGSGVAQVAPGRGRLVPPVASRRRGTWRRSHSQTPNQIYIIANSRPGSFKCNGVSTGVSMGSLQLNRVPTGFREAPCNSTGIQQGFRLRFQYGFDSGRSRRVLEPLDGVSAGGCKWGDGAPPARPGVASPKKITLSYNNILMHIEYTNYVKLIYIISYHKSDN
jgi:hypothetical protein